MSHALARQAIEAKLLAWSKQSGNPPVIFGLSKAYPTNLPYLHGYLMPALTTAPYLAADGLNYVGVYQVSIVCNPDQPIGNAENIVNKLSDLFMVDSLLEQGGFSGIVIEPVSQGPTIVEASKYTVPVSFRYRGTVDLP